MPKADRPFFATYCLYAANCSGNFRCPLVAKNDLVAFDASDAGFKHNTGILMAIFAHYRLNLRRRYGSMHRTKKISKRCLL
jgi:hypothetical protein